GAIAGPLDDLASETLDLVGSHFAEVFVQPLARLDLLTIYEQRARAGQGVTGRLIKVAKEREVSVLKRAPTVSEIAVVPRNKVVNEFRSCGVVTHDDKTRRNTHSALSPSLKR